MLKVNFMSEGLYVAELKKLFTISELEPIIVGIDCNIILDKQKSGKSSSISIMQSNDLGTYKSRHMSRAVLPCLSGFKITKGTLIYSGVSNPSCLADMYASWIASITS